MSSEGEPVAGWAEVWEKFASPATLKAMNALERKWSLLQEQDVRAIIAHGKEPTSRPGRRCAPLTDKNMLGIEVQR